MILLPTWTLQVKSYVKKHTCYDTPQKFIIVVRIEAKHKHLSLTRGFNKECWKWKTSVIPRLVKHKLIFLELLKILKI